MSRASRRDESNAGPDIGGVRELNRHVGVAHARDRGLAVGVAGVVQRHTVLGAKQREPFAVDGDEGRTSSSSGVARCAGSSP